jgi:dTMP kinase
MRGKFITLEGLDGAGKSTHLEWLAAELERRGVRVRVTREPGGTEAGERLREMLLDRRQRLHPETEALLMFAARREHLDKLILPALDAGSWVVCDRFTDATFAYQSGGSGVGWHKIAALEQWTQGGLQPDLTLYFDVPPAVGRARAGGSREPDRFEQEREAFHERVREAYLRRARECAGRIRVVAAGGDIDGVRAALVPLLDAFLEKSK